MFLHIFIYRFRCLVRDRMLMFWSFLFPILLSTLFFLAFANLNKTESFEKIPLAVADNAAYQGNAAFQSALKAASSGKNGAALFNVTVCKPERALELLSDGKVDGVLILSDSSAQVRFEKTGVSQSIIKAFADDYLQTAEAMRSIARQDPSALRRLTGLSQSVSYLKNVPASSASPDDMLTYYYALLAFACLYGSFWGLKEMGAVQANQTPQGARVSVAPVHKIRAFLPSLCAALIVQLGIILIQLAYLALALHITFGPRVGLVLLACILGSAMGVLMGAAAGAIFQKSETAQVMILVAFCTISAFFAGLMQSSVKYMIERSIPAFPYINPATLIADSFYALYYYTSLTRYWVNLALMGGYTVLFGAIVYFALRRRRYASL